MNPTTIEEAKALAAAVLYTAVVLLLILYLDYFGSGG